MSDEISPLFEKSAGTTETERLLANLCDRTFLRLWSYPNPFKEDGKELCDLLAVFEDHVFIFFDRKNTQLDRVEADPNVSWSRWKKDVIESQIRTARGAERYLRSGRKVFLDSRQTTEFPLAIKGTSATYHKIIVAHGAKEACKKASEQNIYGSLAISYSGAPKSADTPFHIDLSKSDPVHIFDSENLEIVLREFNTIHDLSTYFGEKHAAIQKVDQFSYCGEEDLVAHYLLNFDTENNRHRIGPNDSETYNFVMIGEGEWRDFVSSDRYRRRAEANEISAVWDDLLQRTCDNYVNRTIGGNANLLRGKSAVHEMAREPRLSRRALSEFMIAAIRNFPEELGPFARNLSFMPSFYPGTGYVFLQLRAPETSMGDYDDYRQKRQAMLEIACGAAKNKFSRLTKVVGIAMEAPKFTRRVSEDLLLMECDDWTEDQQKFYEDANQELDFFATKRMRSGHTTIEEFP
jgi:hypothetical protein